MRENHLKWHEHVKKRHMDTTVRQCEPIKSSDVRR